MEKSIDQNGDEEQDSIEVVTPEKAEALAERVGREAAYIAQLTQQAIRHY